MIVKERNGTEVYAAAGVTGRLLRSYEGGQLLKLEIAAGVSLKPHLVDFAAEFYVLEGTGNYLYQGEEVGIVSGDLVWAEADTERGFINTGSGPLQILVIKH